MIRPFSFLESRPYYLLIPILALALWMAYSNAFIQDDAFISFRYAKYFAEGNGLVWYPGSDEFGYTNFLFALAIGLLLSIGIEAPMAAMLISVPAYVLSIILIYLIGRRTASPVIVIFLTCLSLVLHHTFSAYATGGLETSLQTCLVLAAYYIVIRWQAQPEQYTLKFLALFSALALLTRLDSSILLFPVYAFLAFHLYQQWQSKKLPVKRIVKTLLVTAGIPTLVVLLLLAFCYLYYGYALPSSFYAKIDSIGHTEEGFRYLHSYIQSQGYVPLFLILIWYLLVKRERFSPERTPYQLLFFACLLLWLCYIIYVGGDFMEFRFLVPVLPLFYLLIYNLIFEQLSLRRHMIWCAVMVVIMQLFSMFTHAQHFIYGNDRHFFIESTRLLNAWISKKDGNWVNVGKVLGKLFYTGKLTDVKIAVTAAGATPFYSGLPTIDQHGLNTREVLTDGGKFYMNRPGHRIKATFDFLSKANINLVIDHPVFLRKQKNLYICVTSPAVTIKHQVDPRLTKLLIPLGEGIYLLAYYDKPHPKIQELIKKKTIIVYDDVKPMVRCEKGFASTKRLKLI